MKNKLLNDIIKKLKSEFGLKNSLYLEDSNFGVFKEPGRKSDLVLHSMKNDVDYKNHVSGDPLITLNEVKNEFDLIIGDLPLGWMKTDYVDKSKNISLKEKKNWIIMLKSLFSLSKNGLGIFLVEPNFYGSYSVEKFVKELNKQGFYVNAIFNAPENILKPETSIRPILVIISRKDYKNMFVAELDDDSDSKLLINNFKDKKSENMQKGLWVKKNEFRGFDKYKISKKLDRLSEQYKEFKKYKINDIAEEVNLGKKLTHKENSIYIPKVGNSPVISDLKKATIKDQNYLQIVLKNKIAKPKYLSLYFNTEVGQLSLQTLFHGSVIPHINKRDIGELPVPLPDISLQTRIINADMKFKQLKSKIEKFEKEIAFNPLSVRSIEGDLNKMLDSLDLLNESEKILSLIREGESKTLELKQTLSKNVHTNKKDKKMEKAFLKTIVAFLNSEGGQLLVGVKDDGELYGIEKDVFKSNDDYLKHVHNLVRDNIGEDFYPLIDYKIVAVNKIKLLLVQCKKSKDPCYLGKEEEFYVRVNPATDKLSGKKLVEYINKHFKK